MKLVTREAWGARPAKCSQPAPNITELIVHYTGMDADEQSDHSNCAARVRGIQRFHQDTRKWCDIAYNFVVCKHGFVFVGRGWHAKSGATGTANAFSMAICFLGDDTANRDDLTQEGREALAEWLRAGVARYGDDTKARVHKDHMSTACPGAEITSFVHSGAWKKEPPKRKVRFQLWVFDPALKNIDHSADAVWPGKARFALFYGRVLPKVFAAVLKGQRPHFRRFWVS